MFGPWEKEVNALVEIMKEVIPLTLHAQEKLESKQFKSKNDGTIVSICDFAAQAVIMKRIQEKLPGDDVLGEEDMKNASPAFLEQVKHLLPPDLDPIEACSRAIRYINPENHRTWVIDPIDGTEGFVKHSSYAIATCLLVDLKPQVSITAWPLHDKKYTGIELEGPVLFIAYEGGKSYAMDLNGNIKEMPKVTSGTPCRLTNNSGRVQNYIAKALNVPNEISLVSMVKGFILATGHANIYCRIHYKTENSWDVAPFEIFIRNCGAIITTGTGEPLEYLPNGSIKGSETGIIASVGGPEFHQTLLKTYQEAVKSIYGVFPYIKH